MKLSAASLIFLLSVGGAAASEDLLLRGSENKSTSHRRLKDLNAKGKPVVVDWRCKDAPDFSTCPEFTAGRGGGDSCQQCCECECDGTTVEDVKFKCMILKKEDAATSVSCSDGAVSYDGTGGSCHATCADVCDPPSLSPSASPSVNPTDLPSTSQSPTHEPSVSPSLSKQPT